MSLNTILATAPLTTQNYILKATGTTIGNSLIWDNGTNVGIGNQGTTYTLDVSGSLRNTTSAYFATTSGSVGIGTASPADKFSVDAGTGNIVTSSFFNSTMTAGQSTFLEFGKNYSNNYNTGELAFKFVGDGSSSNMVSIGFYGAGNKLNVLGNGNVGIGTSNPSAKFMVLSDTNTSATNIGRFAAANNTLAIGIGYETIRQTETGGSILFETNATERMRITSGGGVGIGTTSVTGTTKLRAISVGAVQGDPLFFSDNGVYNSIGLYAAGADGYNGAACVMIMGKNTNNRSINAGGSINASGNDYAEYMTKAIEDNIAKGDIVGINQNGLLTNVFMDAKSFVVKSTDPSYVGGDTWGNVDDIGKLPLEATEEEKAEYNNKLEAARAKVDRIAFSGQVPCNVYDANVGDYIIPIDDNGIIKGQAITNPTFEEYQISVGKVWKIMEDGRAWIAVKIG